jgi:hypothetical protein
LDADTVRGLTPQQITQQQLLALALALAIAGCTERSQDFVVQADACPPFGNCMLDVSCVAGEVVTGGGCTTPTFATEPAGLRDSGPVGQGWHCTFGDTDSSQTLRATAICCIPTPTQQCQIATNSAVIPPQANGDSLYADVEVSCPSGTAAPGGGCECTELDGHPCSVNHDLTSHPLSGGWRCQFEKEPFTQENRNGKAYAVCCG